jgi:hypothetical protein
VLEVFDLHLNVAVLTDRLLKFSESLPVIFNLVAIVSQQIIQPCYFFVKGSILPLNLFKLILKFLIAV